MILTFKIKKRFSAAIIGLNADVKINAFLIWMKNYIVCLLTNFLSNGPDQVVALKEHQHDWLEEAQEVHFECSKQFPSAYMR